MRLRERAAGNATSNPKKPPRTPIPPITTTLFTMSKSKPNCCYCQQSHYPSSCNEMVLPEKRKAILRGAGRCLICLKRGHISKLCRSSSRCNICHGKHHISVCAWSVSSSKPPTEGQTVTNSHFMGVNCP